MTKKIKINLEEIQERYDEAIESVEDEPHEWSWHQIAPHQNSIADIPKLLEFIEYLVLEDLMARDIKQELKEGTHE